MGLFSKRVDEMLTTNDSTTDNNIKQEELKEEWIWVEGYKGTDRNMICRDIQYEINKTYTYNGVIELCSTGYHFCKELNNVFEYYSFNFSNRFFKVKCLVRKNDWNKDIDKFTAKEIVFTEELGYQDLEQFITKKYKFITGEDDWNTIKKDGVDKFYKNYFVNYMTSIGYGCTFANILYDRVNHKRTEEEKQRERVYLDSLKRSIYIGNTPHYFYQPYESIFDFNEFEKILDKVKAFNEENISKDMAVYLLLTV